MPRASSNSGADRVRKAQAAAAAAAVAHAPPAVVLPPPRPSPVPSAAAGGRSTKAVSRASPRAPPSEIGGAGGGRVAISAGLANLQLAEESQKKSRASTPGPQNGGGKGRKAVGSGGRGRKVIEEEEEEEEIEEAEEKVEERKVSPPPVKRSPKVSEGKKAKEVVKAPVVEEADAEAEEEETEAEETEAEAEAEEEEAEEEEEEEGEVEFNPPPPPQPRPKLGSKAAAATAAAAASALKPTLQVSPPLTPGTRQGVLAEESGKRSLWVGGALVLVAVVVYTVMHGLPHSLSIPPMEATLSRVVATLRACRGAMDCGNPLPPGSPLACVFTPVQLLQQGGGTEGGGSDGGVDLGSVEPFLRGLEGRLGAGVNISQPLSSLSNITIPPGMGSTPLLSWCSIKKGVVFGLWAILDWVWWVITHHPLPTLIGGAGAALVWRVSQARTAAAARALLEERVERYQLFCEAMLMQVDERGGYPWFPLPTLRDAAIGVVTDGVSGELLGGGEREALKKEWGRVEEKLKGDGRFEVGAYLPHAGGVQQLGIRCVVPPTAAPQQLQQLRMRAESRGRKR